MRSKKTRLWRFRKTSKTQRPKSRRIKSSRKNIGGSESTKSPSTKSQSSSYNASVASNTNNDDVTVEVTNMDGHKKKIKYVVLKNIK